MNKSVFVYVTYIRSTPEKVWNALTTPEFMRQYWFGMHCESDWKAGATWRLVFTDGRIADSGEIVESNPPQRLVIKWQNEWKPELKSEGNSLCAFEIEVVPGVNQPAVKLTVTHSMDRPASKLIEAVSGGWPGILSNLKSLLETGEIAFRSTKSNA